MAAKKFLTPIDMGANKVTTTATATANADLINKGQADSTYQAALGFTAVPNTRTVNGHALSADVTVTKGDVSLGSVDNVQQLPMSYLDTDGTLAANSDSKVPSQKAVKTYADQIIAATGAMVYKGVIDCSGNPNYPASTLGWTYKISVAGKIGGASGINVEVGDQVLCCVTSASGDQATVGANFNIIQVNIDGAVIGPASATSTNIATFSGTTGKLIADGGVAISALVPTSRTVNGHALTDNVTVTASDVSLGNVSNDAQLKIASNLSDLNSASTARTNLGLGGAAVLNVGTTTGTVAAGDDSRIVAAVPNTRTVNGHALSADVTVTKGDVSLGNVTNDAQIPLSTVTTANDFIVATGNAAVTRKTASQVKTILDVSKVSVSANNGNVVVDGSDVLVYTLPALSYAASIGNASDTDIIVTHNLNTKDVIVAVYDNTTPFAEVGVDVSHTSVNTVTIGFATAPTSNQYRVVVKK